LFLPVVAGITLAALSAVAAFFTRDHWLGWLTPDHSAATDEDHTAASAEEPRVLKLGPQARANLGLVSRPITLQHYWRSIQVPGVVVDRPAYSDRGVTAPAVSVVAKVHAFPGDTVRSGDRLFTLRLVSEHLQNSQAELYKTAQEVKIVQERQERMREAHRNGAIAEATWKEVQNQLDRLNASYRAYRQDLLARGLTPAHLDSVAEGRFISEVEVVAPPTATNDKQLVSSKKLPAPSFERSEAAPAYEVQELKIELGQQVQAGQTLCLLANHQSLYVEGHAFRRDAPDLEQAAQQGWSVRVEFSEDDRSWPPLEQTFTIHHLANSVDPTSRTFTFYLPLANQSRSYERDGRIFLVWRFRTGQRVRLHVPVEEFTDVFVLPVGAVAREGPEAFVFRQNGDLFDRRAVQVLYEDRLSVVLAKDGSVTPGMYLAQSAAATLNRVLKAQNANGGLPPGAHIHADGSLHIPGQ
jgi:biotin carboxyl carrier protein